MLPLVRLKVSSFSFKFLSNLHILLKVDTTGVTETSNPIRFGQEFQGRIANPRDLLVFHRSKKSASRSAKVAIDQPELSIDDPDLTNSEKLAKVRVGTLVKEYLAAQELQLLGENGMSDAIQMFVDKDDIHAISTYVSFILPFLFWLTSSIDISHVTKSLKLLMKNVQTNEDLDVDENELEDLVCLFFTFLTGFLSPSDVLLLLTSW